MKEGSINTDLSFLLSPRHFSEAVANGSVAGMSDTAALDGLATFRYFQRLADILNRTANDKLVRHARWSHHHASVLRRIRVWVSRIGEWDGQADTTEPSLDPIRMALERQKIEEPWLPSHSSPISDPVDKPLSAQTIIGQADRLLDEGRKGAAQELLREGIRGIDRFMRSTAPANWPSLLNDMVALGEKLAQLGDVDGAAVFLVRYVDYLDQDQSKRAFAVLSRSREADDVNSERTSIVAISPDVAGTPAKSQPTKNID